MSRFVILPLVLLLACDNDDTKDIDPDKIVKVAIPNKDSYAADGFTKIPVIITIDKDADVAFRQPTITTSQGKFENNETTIQLDLRKKETDTTYITPGLNAVDVIVKAEVGSDPKYSNQESLTLQSLEIGRVFKEVTTTHDPIFEADGTSEATINITQGILSPIRFVTEKGTLRQFGGEAKEEIEIDGGEEKKVAAILKVGRQAGNYRILFNTTLAPYTSEVNIDVPNAYPEKLIVDLSTIRIDSTGGDVSITIQTIRTQGLVSINLPVTVSAYSENDPDLFDFTRYLKTSEAETIAVTFKYPGQLMKVGENIVIEVSVDAKPNPLTSSRKVKIYKP
ncbi:MAG: hypothetical protein WDO14_12770 [Bacteroidota bacterium]